MLMMHRRQVESIRCRESVEYSPSSAMQQRELALYVYHNLDKPLTSYLLDKDISPVFKGAPVLRGKACSACEKCAVA